MSRNVGPNTLLDAAIASVLAACGGRGGGDGPVTGMSVAAVSFGLCTAGS